VERRAGLDEVEKLKCLVVQPVASHYTDCAILALRGFRIHLENVLFFKISESINGKLINIMCLGLIHRSVFI
jgi:hypothetical protein